MATQTPSEAAPRPRTKTSATKPSVGTPRVTATAKAPPAGAPDATRGARSPMRQVLGSAGGEVSEMAHQFLSEGRLLLEEAAYQVRSQVDQQGERLIEGARVLASQVDELAAQQSKPLDGYLAGLADRIGTLADGLEERGVKGVWTDLEQVARKHPTLFVIGAATVGVGAGRLARTGSSRTDQSAQELNRPELPALTRSLPASKSR